MPRTLLIIKKEDVEKAMKTLVKVSPHTSGTFDVPLYTSGVLTHYVACWDMTKKDYEVFDKENKKDKYITKYMDVSIHEKKDDKEGAKMKPAKKIESLGLSQDSKK